MAPTQESQEPASKKHWRMMTERIVVADLARTYGSGDAAVRALRSVSFEIAEHEVIALTGPSGSGKTTLLNCLLGLDTPTHGSVDMFSTRIDELTYEQSVAWRRDNAAIVFQTPGLLPHLSAWENVELVLRLRNVARQDRIDRVDEVLKRLQLEPFGDHRPGELSGGQRKRFALARAMATRPRLLVADEPTGELDVATSQQVLAGLGRWARARGTTMILATHDREVEQFADRTLHLVDGRVQT